jgi:two-component system, LytTR family, response regulator
MTIHCIIVDDEPIARDILTHYIGQVPYLNLVGSCSDAFEAMELIKKGGIDLVILDINMPRFTGFEMLRSLKKYPAIIITSAYPEYALEGFELAVTDYLLKPFSFQRFVQATEKTIKTNQELPSTGIGDDAEAYIMVKSDKKLTKLFFREISYVEAYGNYILIYRGLDKIISKQTLTEFEKQLPASKFIRVHKSFVISLAAIKYFEGNQVAIGNKNIPIGKVYRENLIKRFQ